MFIERPSLFGKGGVGNTGALLVLFWLSSRKPAGVPAVASPAHWPGRLAHLPGVWRVLRRVVASAELPTRFTARKRGQEGNFPFSVWQEGEGRQDGRPVAKSAAPVGSREWQDAGTFVMNGPRAAARPTSHCNGKVKQTVCANSCCSNEYR